MPFLKSASCKGYVSFCGTNDATAWLVIEPENKPWPVLSAKLGQTAGSFMLVWQNADLPDISQEYWPWDIYNISVSSGRALQEFAAIYPTDNPKLQNGFKVYLRTCAACHTLNHLGSGKMGPDLNIPINPTVYFTKGILEKLVRKPNSIRDWPDAKMSGFNESQISDNDLHDLITYLQFVTMKQDHVNDCTDEATY